MDENTALGKKHHAPSHRYFLPDDLWHISHRCHKKGFLLKFAKDRKSWRHWLFEARKRFGLGVLKDSINSNRIYLLVRDRGQGEIKKSMQLVAGGTAQELNQRNENELKSAQLGREPVWTQSQATGHKDYVEGVKFALGMAGRHRSIVHGNDACGL